MDIPLYQISFNGYRGTVEVSLGTVKVEFPKTTVSEGLFSGTDKMKRYHFCLLTPLRQNIEFELFRLSIGEWLDWWMLHSVSSPEATSELRAAAKKEIERMDI